MVILKENIGPTHWAYIKGCGDFTQVKITYVNSIEEQVVAQFFGRNAKINANKFLDAMNWNDVHVDLTA